MGTVVYVDKECPDQTAWMCKLIWTFAVHVAGWMDGYFIYRRSTLKGHIASNKLYII